MARKFGIELEVVAPAGRSLTLWGRIHTGLMGIGIDARQTGYGGCDYTRWQLKQDSSVRAVDGNAGCEIVSPVLVGEEGLEQVRRVCDVLVAAEATANRSCGMHVHVDVRDLSLEQIRNIHRAYGSFQDIINSVLPQSRRANQYCRRLWSTLTERDYLARLERCNSVFDIYRIPNTRYTVLNMAKYTSTGTMEFRQHSGTVEPEKALNWARWCLAFVETYKDVNVMAPAPADGATVYKRITGRGQIRNATRGLTARLIREMRQRPISEAEIQTWINTTPRCQGDVWSWLVYLANQYGQTLEKIDGGWRIAIPVNPMLGTAQTPFEQCFGLYEGALQYFGRRRALLA